MRLKGEKRKISFRLFAPWFGGGFGKKFPFNPGTQWQPANFYKIAPKTKIPKLS